jgi:hypothetical protein
LNILEKLDGGCLPGDSRVVKRPDFIEDSKAATELAEAARPEFGGTAFAAVAWSQRGSKQ